MKLHKRPRDYSGILGDALRKAFPLEQDIPGDQLALLCALHRGDCLIDVLLTGQDFDQCRMIDMVLVSLEG